MIFKKATIIGVIALTTSACTSTNTASVYVAGLSYHTNSDHPDTNEGHMKYFGVSTDYERNDWQYENGLTIFTDSYSQRSLMLTSNISHKNWLYYDYLRPMIGLNCAYKGYSHDHDKRRWLCTPPLKLRVGKETGWFTNIMATPKVGNITNGLIAAEIGYKYKW